MNILTNEENNKCQGCRMNIPSFMGDYCEVCQPFFTATKVHLLNKLNILGQIVCYLHAVEKIKLTRVAQILNINYNTCKGLWRQNKDQELYSPTALIELIKEIQEFLKYISV